MNPFFNQNDREGLIFFSVVNLILLALSIPVNILAALEASFYKSFNPTILNEDEVEPENTTEWAFGSGAMDSSHIIKMTVIFLAIDVVISLVQIYNGISLTKAVQLNLVTYIRKSFLPSIIVFGLQAINLILYMSLLPVSPYFIYFTSLALLYRLFLFWPIFKYSKEHCDDPCLIAQNARSYNFFLCWGLEIPFFK